MTTPPDGVHFGVSEEEYDLWEAVRNSTLGKFVDRSDQHAYYDLFVGAADTPATRFGTAFHLALLEPDRFEKEVIERIPGPFRSNEAKAKREQQVADNPLAIILPQEELDQISAMQAAVFRSALCREILSGPGRNEVSLIWTDPEWDIRCKARLDAIREWRAMFTMLDLKSSRRDSTREDFQRDMGDFGFYRQEQFYRRGFEVLEGPAVREFLFLMVPKAPPHVPGVFMVDNEAQMQGMIEIDNAMLRYKRCMESGAWPGWGTEPRTAELPAWKRRRRD